MLTAAVGVQAGLEADVGAVVVGDDAAGLVFKELGRGTRLVYVFRVRVGVGEITGGFKPAGGVLGSASPGQLLLFHFWVQALPLFHRGKRLKADRWCDEEGSKGPW